MEAENAPAQTDTPEIPPCSPGLKWVLNGFGIFYFLLAAGGLALAVKLVAEGWMADYGPKLPGESSPFPIFFVLVIVAGLPLFMAKACYHVGQAFLKRSDLGLILLVAGGICFAPLLLWRLGGEIEIRILQGAALIGGLATLWLLKHPQVVAVFPAEEAKEAVDEPGR